MTDFSSIRRGRKCQKILEAGKRIIFVNAIYKNVRNDSMELQNVMGLMDKYVRK